jgi:hypothetical protein
MDWVKLFVKERVYYYQVLLAIILTDEMEILVFISEK